jgi:hypothetical protein
VNAKIDAEQELSMNEKRFVAERIEDEQMRLDELIRITQEEKLLEEERLQNKINQYKQGTQARLDAEIEYLTTKQELDQQLIELETQKAKKQEQIEMDLAAAKKTIQDSQISNVEAGINLLSQLAGENRELQALSIAAENAVGIAKIIINTQAANAAAKLKYAAIPGGLALAAAEITANKVSAGIGIAASAAAAAKGMATLRKSVPIDRGGNLGGGSTPNANEQLSSPNFNVVGATGISQTEELQPVKAYVVSGDVTTAQSLDRNRIQNATF